MSDETEQPTPVAKPAKEVKAVIKPEEAAKFQPLVGNPHKLKSPAYPSEAVRRFMPLEMFADPTGRATFRVEVKNPNGGFFCPCDKFSELYVPA